MKKKIIEVTAAEGNSTYPAYIRLPKSPAHCPLTGLSKSSLNELILPCAANGFSPPVKSVSLKKRGATRGPRLIDVESLLSYLRGLNGEEVAA